MEIINDVVKRQYANFAKCVIDMITKNDYRTVGIFFYVHSDEDNLEQFTRAFKLDQLKNVQFTPVFGERTFEKMANYDMSIVVNRIFNCSEYKISYEKKWSYDYNARGNKPVIQLNFHLTN